MIRNGKLLDVKSYVDFVAKHPNKPDQYRTYFDWYLAETKHDDGKQLSLNEATRS